MGAVVARYLGGTDGIVDIPRHHVVRNPRAREGLYLRSVPNESLADDLVR